MEQPALDRKREIAVVQIDFSAAFDSVSHSYLLYKLRDVGVDGAIFDVPAGFSRSRVRRVEICSENVRVVSGVPEGSILSSLLFLRYISYLPIILENTFVGYADVSALLTELP